MISKPAYPILQRGHPLAQGLIGAYAVYEGSGGSVYDLSGRQAHGTLVGGTSWGGSPYGTSVSGDGATGDITAALTFDPSEFTIGFVMRYVSGNVGFRDDTAVAGSFAFWHNASLWRARLNNNNLTSTVATASFSGIWSTFVVGASTTSFMYFNGDLVQSGTNIGSATSTSPIHFLRSGTGAARLEADLAIVCIWNRGLSVEAVRRWTEDPWEMYREPAPVWLFGGSIAPIVADNIEADMAIDTELLSTAAIDRTINEDMAIDRTIRESMEK